MLHQEPCPGILGSSTWCRSMWNSIQTQKLWGSNTTHCSNVPPPFSLTHNYIAIHYTSRIMHEWNDNCYHSTDCLNISSMWHQIVQRCFLPFSSLNSQKFTIFYISNLILIFVISDLTSFVIVNQGTRLVWSVHREKKNEAVSHQWGCAESGHKALLCSVICMHLQSLIKWW